MKTLPYYHVDVFSDKPFFGNGLTVFTESEGLSKASMLTLTQEMRQFESTFLRLIEGNKYRANIFTCQEELDFAGHPTLGAAAVLHDQYQTESETAEWEFVLNKKTVEITTRKEDGNYKARMNQGKAEFGMVLNEQQTSWLLKSLSLNENDLYPGCSPLVVSTGLPYLIVPLQQNGFKAKICITDLEEKIRAWGAMFIGILEIPTLSIRTWDNLGAAEDIATGSLAGPSGAFLVKHGFYQQGATIQINQGHNLGRPAKLMVEVDSNADVYVSGYVCKISENMLVAAEYLTNL
jgi:trans-2,3-dihydro-3-hydroxyanthranilate isomerase